MGRWNRETPFACAYSIAAFANIAESRTGVIEMLTPIRRWVARRLYMWSCEIYEDWHEVELTNVDGVKIQFCCYGDLTGSWPGDWEFSCSCESGSSANDHAI
jgi:hypothetical protein